MASNKLPAPGTRFRVKDDPPNPTASPMFMEYMKEFCGKELTHVGYYKPSESWTKLYLCSEDKVAGHIWWRLEWVDIIGEEALEEIFYGLD